MALTANPISGALPNDLEVEIRMTRGFIFTCHRCPKKVRTEEELLPDDWGICDGKDLCPSCDEGLRLLENRQGIERFNYLAQKGGG